MKKIICCSFLILIFLANIVQAGWFFYLDKIYYNEEQWWRGGAYSYCIKINKEYFDQAVEIKIGAIAKITYEKDGFKRVWLAKILADDNEIEIWSNYFRDTALEFPYFPAILEILKYDRKSPAEKIEIKIMGFQPIRVARKN